MVLAPHSDSGSGGPGVHLRRAGYASERGQLLLLQRDSVRETAGGESAVHEPGADREVRGVLPGLYRGTWQLHGDGRADEGDYRIGGWAVLERVYDEDSSEERSTGEASGDGVHSRRGVGRGSRGQFDVFAELFAAGGCGGCDRQLQVGSAGLSVSTGGRC